LSGVKERIIMAKKNNSAAVSCMKEDDLIVIIWGDGNQTRIFIPEKMHYPQKLDIGTRSDWTGYKL
jgi:hypothetical protein